MIWIERTEDLFVRARLRRTYRRGKRADRQSLLEQSVREMLEALWAPVFTRRHPFLD